VSVWCCMSIYTTARTFAPEQKKLVLDEWIEALQRRPDAHHEAHDDAHAWLSGGSEVDRLLPWVARWLIHKGPGLNALEGGFFIDDRRRTLESLCDTLPLLHPLAVRLRRGKGEVIMCKTSSRGWALDFEVQGDSVFVDVYYCDEGGSQKRRALVVPCFWLWITPIIEPQAARLRA